jgi:hypothetical protein
LPCDGGGAQFPRDGFTTNLYGDLYPVGSSIYRTVDVDLAEDYAQADYTYQLWGNANLLPLTSGNVANRWQYKNTTADATSEWSSSYPALGVNDGDRKGAGWQAGGGWNSLLTQTTAAPQSVRVVFDQPRTITRINVFTVQNTYDVPVDPTLTTSASQYGIRDYSVEYCPVGLTCIAGSDSNWQVLAQVTGNTSAWRLHVFGAVTATAVRVRVTAANGGLARITEVEAWE